MSVEEVEMEDWKMRPLMKEDQLPELETTSDHSNSPKAGYNEFLTPETSKPVDSKDSLEDAFVEYRNQASDQMSEAV